ncbi:hypothetical protein CH367_08030 [Leptospira barantonii]|uniref:Lipoprotein n=2 Tax=Leptospira barantonii TaxID=2023184 RepID=A0ABX4NNC4_9LEPT|nr:hypothetical protein CH367_08030 [Leptospira barantonii]
MTVSSDKIESKKVFFRDSYCKKTMIRLFLFVTFWNCKANSPTEQEILRYAAHLGETKCECEKIERKEGADSEDLSVCLNRLEDAQRKYGIHVRKLPELSSKAELLVQRSYAIKCSR